MNHFYACDLATRAANFAMFESAFEQFARGVLPGGGLPGTAKNFRRELEQAVANFERVQMRHATESIAAILGHVHQAGTNQQAAALMVEARNAKDTVLRELKARKFLRVALDRGAFLDKENGFGPDVAFKFEDAKNDIREAGNCLAAECGTAAVFHLMRVAEFGLRALARDRRVEFADKPLEQKEWGQILPNLESKIRVMRDLDRPKWQWPDTVVREAQISFYSDVTQELRAFNDVWRRHVSHADSHAFYDRDQAISVWNHVRAFMEKLSSKVSASSITPEFWTSS
jgi:hypothetical protein